MKWYIFLAVISMEGEPMEIRIPNQAGFQAQQLCEKVVDAMKHRNPGLSRWLFCKQEAAEKVRKRGDEYMQNCEASYQDTYEMRRVNSGRARALKDVADALDRLASEGAPSPIDLLPKFNDDGTHG